MKRIFVCLLVCVLLIPGMLPVVSAAEEEWPDPVVIYDETAAYFPNCIIVQLQNYDPRWWGWMMKEEYFGELSDKISHFNMLSDFEPFPSEWTAALTFEIVLKGYPTRQELLNACNYIAALDTPFPIYSISPKEWNSYADGDRSIVDYTEVDWDALTEQDQIDSISIRLLVWNETWQNNRDQFPYSEAFFPELELSGVYETIEKDEHGFWGDWIVHLVLKDPGKETLIDAVDKLAMRAEFQAIDFDFAFTPPKDDTEETTAAETTAADTTAETTVAETTTAPAPDRPADDKPDSPKTGDAGVHAACVTGIALLGVVCVIVYRRKYSA